MSEDLVDKIVEDEALGIKKKPSIIKIVSSAFVLLIAALMGYSIFIKSQAAEEQPPLNIGQATPTQSITQPIVPVSSEPIQAAPANTTSAPIQTASPATSPVIVTQSVAVAPQAQPQVVVTSTSPAQSTPHPIQAQSNAATANTTPSPVQAQAITATPPVQTVEQFLGAPSQPTNPNVVAETAPATEKPKKVFKPKYKTSPVRKVVIEQNKLEAQAIEEGVTKEEIIVIQ